MRDADIDLDGAIGSDAALTPPGVGLCDFDPALPWDSLDEILQVYDPRGDTCLWLSRRNECPPDGICKAVPFTLLHVRVGHAGSVMDVDDPDALSWESTHHNWCDQGEAWNDTTRYRIEVRVDELFHYFYQLTAFDIDTGATLWSRRLIPFAPTSREITAQPAPAEVMPCGTTF